MNHRLATAVTAFLALVPSMLAQESNSGSPQTGIPSGMVAFFSKSSCPPGWEPAPKAQGRLLVAVADVAQVGVEHGEALAGRDLPYHFHSYQGEFRYGEQDSAADHRNLHNTVEPGTVVQVSGESQSAWIKLPLTHLPVCRPAGQP